MYPTSSRPRQNTGRTPSSTQNIQNPGRMRKQRRMTDLYEMIDDHLAWQDVSSSPSASSPPPITTKPLPPTPPSSLPSTPQPEADRELIVDWDGTGSPRVSWRALHSPSPEVPLRTDSVIESTAEYWARVRSLEDQDMRRRRSREGKRERSRARTSSNESTLRWVNEQQNREERRRKDDLQQRGKVDSQSHNGVHAHNSVGGEDSGSSEVLIINTSKPYTLNTSNPPRRSSSRPTTSMPRRKPRPEAWIEPDFVPRAQSPRRKPRRTAAREKKVITEVEKKRRSRLWDLVEKVFAVLRGRSEGSSRWSKM